MATAAQRAAPSAALVETMQRQHQRVDEYAAQVEPLVGPGSASRRPSRGEQLARVVEQFAAALVEHLDLEEREILPLVSRHLTVAEWDSLGGHGKESMSSRELPLMFGAILEDADASERTRMLAHLPAPIRLVMRTAGRAAVPPLHHPRARRVCSRASSATSAWDAVRPASQASAKARSPSTKRAVARSVSAS